MKKGCFLSAIILLTIIIGAGIYVFREYGNQFENYGKVKIMELVSEKVVKKIDELKSNSYRDSLKAFITYQTENLKKQNIEDAFNNFQVIMDKTKIIIKDGIIDSAEFSSLKNLAIENERPKKN